MQTLNDTKQHQKRATSDLECLISLLVEDYFPLHYISPVFVIHFSF